MKIAIVTGLFTERDMDVDTGHWCKDTAYSKSIYFL